MNLESGFIFLFILVVAYSVYTVWKYMDPKIDWNYETGEKLLWYNDPFDFLERKRIVIGRRKPNSKL